MNSRAILVLVIAVGLIAVDAPPSTLSHSRSGRQTGPGPNQPCRQSIADETSIVWVPPTSDITDYIIVQDLDTGEYFELCSNDPVSRDLTIFVLQPSQWHILLGNPSRTIEIRNNTHVYHSGRIDKIAQCEDSPCRENLTMCGCPRIFETLQPSVPTSPTTLETNPVDKCYWCDAATGLLIALVVVLVLWRVHYIILSGGIALLYKQDQKVRRKSGPERVPQHIRRYCASDVFLEISDFRRRNFESTHFECGVFQYRGRVFPLYVYEGELEDIPQFGFLPQCNGFLVPKAGDNNNSNTLQVYSTVRELIYDLKSHLEDSHHRDLEHRKKMEEEIERLTLENSKLAADLSQSKQTSLEEIERLTLENSKLAADLSQSKQTSLDEHNKLKEEIERLTLENSKLAADLSQSKQTSLDELKKLKEENERLVLENSKLAADLSQSKQTSLEENERLTQLAVDLSRSKQTSLEKSSHKVEGWLDAKEGKLLKFRDDEWRVEKLPKTLTPLIAEGINNVPEQSDPSSFTDEFGSEDHPYVKDDHWDSSHS